MYVWNVYDQEKMLQYQEMGLGGIITGYPQLLEEVLGSYESRHAGMEYAHLRGSPPAAVNMSAHTGRGGGFNQIAQK